MVVRPSKGGIFGHVVSLGSALAAGGYDVVICGPHAAHTGLGVPVLDFDIPRHPTPRSTTRAISDLRAAERKFRPDILHAHGSQGGALARIARIANPRLPVVLTMNMYPFANYFPRRSERAAYRLIEQALGPLATRVICVCEEERRRAAKVGPRSRTRVVYNGIEPIERIAPNPAADALAERGPLITVVSELVPRKGYTTLIDSMPSVLGSVPDANLAIGGGGPFEGALAERATALGVADRVHFLGDLDDVSGALARSDVFVHPSWAEAFPYAILEAMSLGAPIVATDVGGVREAIEDGVTGRLVPPQDPDALGSALVSVLDDRDAARRFGEAARERMLSRFTLEHMVEGNLRVYREIGLP